jgi:hypothetical protein
MKQGKTFRLRQRDLLAFWKIGLSSLFLSFLSFFLLSCLKSLKSRLSFTPGFSPVVTRYNKIKEP